MVPTGYPGLRRPVSLGQAKWTTTTVCAVDVDIDEQLVAGERGAEAARGCRPDIGLEGQLFRPGAPSTVDDNDDELDAAVEALDCVSVP